MPDWISDPPNKIYLILALIAGLPLLAAFFLMGSPRHSPDSKDKKSSHRGKLIVVSVIGLLLLVGLKVADFLLESPSEQIVRKMKEMSDGVAERNLDKTFGHVSDKFRVGPANKAQLRALGESALQTGQVTSIPFWDVLVDSIDKDAGKAIVNFRFKINGNALTENQFIGEATFVREENNQWRLLSFKVYPPTGKKDEYTVPGLN